MPMALYYNIEERATEEVLKMKELYGDDWWEHVGITNLHWWFANHPEDEEAKEKYELENARMAMIYREMWYE